MCFKYKQVWTKQLPGLASGKCCGLGFGVDEIYSVFIKIIIKKILLTFKQKQTKI